MSKTDAGPVPEHFNFGVDVVDRWARERDGPALITCDAEGNERTYSYSDIARLTDKLASALRERGLRKGDRVLIMLPRIVQWQVTMVACLKLGAVPVPCIEMLTPKDLNYRIGHSGARAVIAKAAQLSKFAELEEHLDIRLCVREAPVPSVAREGWDDWEAALLNGPRSFEAAQVAANDPALLYYTSGSTGQPKGVLHASHALYAWRVSADAWLDLRPGDTIWCTADTGWSKAGTSILIGPWSQGACSFFYDGPFDPAQRLRLLARHRITVYCAPGTELFRLVDEPIGDHDLSALRRVVSAGEALNPVVAKRWFDATGLAVAEAYGQTETLMTLITPPGQSPRPGLMGIAAPGCELRVADEEGFAVAPGDEGELVLRVPNPQVMLGYWNDPERTAQCFYSLEGESWYRTGDRAVCHPDGWFEHRGRVDDVINSAGYRIGPMEVEAPLLEHPSVLEAAVVGRPDKERGEIVAAYVVLRPGFVPSAALAEELQQHVKRLTAPYKYPRAVEFIDEIPKTTTGKLRRAALRGR